MYDGVARVSDVEAVALCRMLREDTGLLVGGSSGCVLAAVLRDLRRGRAAARSTCVCPDGGDRYLNTIFDDAWLLATGIGDPVEAIMSRARDAGLTFTGVRQ
jgi:cysteine synthase A